MMIQITRRLVATSIRHACLMPPRPLVSARLFSGLPYHLVVGMPALSPTMETGTIAAWKVKEGDSFAAGESLAEIETDKASIDFEAQDDGVVAKILVSAGTADISVGKPIMVTVEDKDDVEAFANFTLEATAEATPEPVAPETPKIAPSPVTAAVESAPTPVAPVVTKPAEQVANAPVPVNQTQEVPEGMSSSVTPTPPTVGIEWGNFARVRSPLAAVLSANQRKYIETYGSTGQVPL